MKNYTLKCILLGLTIGFISCSKDSNEIEDITYTSSESFERTSGGTCGSSVNFQDLLIETSWISEDKNDKDTFDACGVDNESWMDKYSDGRVMIKCLAEDGQRTELKEDFGDEAALYQYKKMKFTGKLTNIPSHGVTIAQIHNRGDNVKRPWIRVYVDSDRSIKIKETETNPTGSSSEYSTFTGPDYNQGSDLTVTIWTGPSGKEKAKIKIQTGGDSWTKNLTASSDWDSNSDTFYLKAGVYTEGSDKEPVMKYSSFYIKH